LYGLNTVALRYFNIFGPRQDPNGPYAAVIPKFIQTLQAGETPVINGDGGQTRDFTYVANAVQANLKACENAERARGQVMNIACGERISLNDLYTIIAEHMGVDRAPIYGPPRAGDVRDSLADITRARTLIGYEPLVTYQEGLKHTVDWFLK
jgi:nucleoside-diphosphate-sugar epimerase